MTDTASYQRAVQTLVDREVYYCVSSLIHALSQDSTSEVIDDIWSICVQDDWQSAAEDAGWYKAADGDMYKNDAENESTIASDWQDLCEHHGIEPYQREAYEHWLVSDWLADRLEAKGEMVARDIHGLTVWGRCTTGQSIILDGIICEIYNDMGVNWHEAA